MCEIICAFDLTKKVEVLRPRLLVVPKKYNPYKKQEFYYIRVC